MHYAHVTIDDLLTRLFVPVARLAIGRGLGIRDVTEPLKRAFLTVAQRQAGPEATDSRIALLTGLQRRDVLRLRREAPASRPAPAPARLLQAWPEDDRLARSGPEPSFEALARAISQDVHPRTLLDLLSDAGAVASEGDAVRLLRRDYVPPAGSDAQLSWLAGNLHDHGMAAVGNVLGDGGFFDRAADFSGQSAAEAAGLAALFEDRQMTVLREVAAAADAGRGDGPVRIRFGGYGYWEEAT